MRTTSRIVASLALFAALIVFGLTAAAFALAA